MAHTKIVCENSHRGSWCRCADMTHLKVIPAEECNACQIGKPPPGVAEGAIVAAAIAEFKANKGSKLDLSSAHVIPLPDGPHLEPTRAPIFKGRLTPAEVEALIQEKVVTGWYDIHSIGAEAHSASYWVLLMPYRVSTYWEGK